MIIIIWNNNIKSDVDGNRIVDKRYNIAGSVGNFDAHPRTYFSGETTTTTLDTGETTGNALRIEKPIFQNFFAQLI